MTPRLEGAGCVLFVSKLDDVEIHVSFPKSWI